MISENIKIQEVLKDEQKIKTYFEEHINYQKNHRRISGLSFLTPNDLFLQSYGKEQCMPDKHPVNKHSLNSLHYVLRGEGFLEINNKKIRVTAGSIFIICANTSVSYYPNSQNPWGYIYLTLGGILQESVLQELNVLRDNYVIEAKKCLGAKDLFLSVYDRALKYGKRNLKTLAALYELLGELSELEHHKMQPTNKESYVLQATNFIANNIDIVTPASVAESCAISTDYLSKLCKEILGLTLKETITLYRMIMARNYLKYSQLSTKKIAELCGYSDKKYFIKVFKSIFLETPAVFKEKFNQDSGRVKNENSQ